MLYRGGPRGPPRASVGTQSVGSPQLPDIVPKDMASLLTAVLVPIAGGKLLAQTDAPHSDILQMLVLE